jgi:hypothetical protein
LTRALGLAKALAAARYRLDAFAAAGMDGIMADRDLKNGAIVAKSDHGDVEMQHLSKAAWADPDHPIN